MVRFQPRFYKGGSVSGASNNPSGASQQTSPVVQRAAPQFVRAQATCRDVRGPNLTTSMRWQVLRPCVARTVPLIARVVGRAPGAPRYGTQRGPRQTSASGKPSAKRRRNLNRGKVFYVRTGLAVRHSAGPASRGLTRS